MNSGDFCSFHLIDDPDAVEIALWYHDAVYKTQLGSDSERESAELAIQRLSKAGVAQSLIDETACLILATKHQNTARFEANDKYLVDIDLSILGKPEPEFDEYELDIRDEYSWVPKADFKKGRSEILEGFLQREKIYSTGFFREKYEDQARNNLQRSIGKLNS